MLVVGSWGSSSGEPADKSCGCYCEIWEVFLVVGYFWEVNWVGLMVLRKHAEGGGCKYVRVEKQVCVSAAVPPI